MGKKWVFGLGASLLLLFVLGCSILSSSKSTEETKDTTPEDIGYSATEGDADDKKAMTEAGEAFLHAIKAEDYEQAFTFATDDFPGAPEDFEQWLTNEIGMPTEWELDNPDDNNGGQGSLAGEITFTDKQKGTVELTMHKTDTGYWRVDDIALTK